LKTKDIINLEAIRLCFKTKEYPVSRNCKEKIYINKDFDPNTSIKRHSMALTRTMPQNRLSQEIYFLQPKIYQTV
jgi:hypothetical protein